MNDVFTLEKKELCLLDSTECGGVRYSFYLLRTHEGCEYYAAEVFDGEAGDMQILGSKSNICRKIYGSIVEGSVSVLHLSEVVRDMAAELLY